MALLYQSVDVVDIVDLAIAVAESPSGQVMQDRNRYAPFFRAAEEYARENELIVGGNTATKLLLGQPLGPSDFYYILYSANALTDARALTDIFYTLAPEGLGLYAAMRTLEPHKEFEISVDERPILAIKGLETYRGTKTVDVLVPSTRPANFIKNDKGIGLSILCMGPEIQLIGLYSALSDPSRAGEWTSLLRDEEGVRALFEKEIKGKISKAIETSPVEGGSMSRKTMSHLVRLLVDEYVPRTGHVVVGHLASHLLGGASPKTFRGRLQLVSSNGFKEEEIAVVEIATRLGVRVQATVADPILSIDPRLRRMTVYLVIPGEKREPFLDVYNAGDYQLIGYTKKAAGQVAVPFVVLRFLLVDIWVIQLLLRMQKTSPNYARQVIQAAVSEFNAVSALYLKYRAREEYSSIFSSDYIGQFRDPKILAKRDRALGRRAGERWSDQRSGRRSDRRTFYPPYYPARGGRSE